jgi:hypothetical protein
MKFTAFIRRVALMLALCIGVFLASGQSGAEGQSKPPEKDPAGSQAGSSGKTADPMGAQGTTESPVRKCDTETTKKKPDKKKKTKKPESAKSGTGSTGN